MNTATASTNLRRIAATAVCSALISFAAVSHAADTNEPRKVTVKYGDLNVSSHEGAAKLYARIAAAAQRVCRPSDSRDLGSQEGLEQCIHTAIANAVTDVGQPELFAIYDAKQETPRPTMLAAREVR